MVMVSGNQLCRKVLPQDLPRSHVGSLVENTAGLRETGMQEKRLFRIYGGCSICSSYFYAVALSFVDICAVRQLLVFLEVFRVCVDLAHYGLYRVSVISNSTVMPRLPSRRTL